MLNRPPFDSYVLETWDGNKLLTNPIVGLSIDAARHIAKVNAWFDYTCKVIAESHNYCETYTKDEVSVGPKSKEFFSKN